jgi:hypothetical protein
MDAQVDVTEDEIDATQKESYYPLNWNYTGYEEVSKEEMITTVLELERKMEHAFLTGYATMQDAIRAKLAYHEDRTIMYAVLLP